MAKLVYRINWRLVLSLLLLSILPYLITFHIAIKQIIEMQLNDEVQLKYDDYEQDFDKLQEKQHQQPVQTHDANMQTTPLQNKKVFEKQEHYEEDFVDASHQSKQLQQKKYTQNYQESNQDNNSRMIDKKIVSDLHNPSRQKMIQQNIKLKTQIYELAKQMDQIMARQKKPKKYGLHAEEEQDQIIKAKKNQLKKQQVQIMNLKNKIFLTKRQLEHVYDSRGIQGKQDQLKSLQKQLKALQDQKDALMKVKKQQNKALKLIRNDNEYEEKIKSLKQSIHKAKQQCKNLSENLVQNQRTLRKNHELYITKQSKIKQMEAKIKQSKQKSKKPTQNSTQSAITPQMITELDNQIVDLQKQRKQAEKTWNEKIHTIQQQLQLKRIQEQKKLLILKDKQKELRLNQIRIKQLKKLINHHSNQVSQKKKKEQVNAEQDMKQFRHKRNIKHLQK